MADGNGLVRSWLSQIGPMEQLYLIVIPLVLGLLLGRKRIHAFDLRVEVAWVLASGVVFVIATTWFLSPFHIGTADRNVQSADLFYYSSNFLDHCISLVHFQDSSDISSPKRSRLAGLLPWLLSRRMGLLDGLAWGALISSGLIGSSIYVWARALAGRLAGISGVLLSLSMAPLVATSRNLTFYPEIIAGLSVGAAACAVAARVPKAVPMLFAGAGIGGCLLIDARGLIWALPLLGGTGLVALFHPGSKKERALRVGALLLPLCVAWFVGAWAYGPQSHSLEEQVDVRSLYYAFDPENPLLAKPWSYSSRYIWGHSPLWEIPMTLRFMYAQAAIPTPEEFLRWQSGGREIFYGGWMRVAGVSAVMCALALRRHPWKQER